MSLTSLEGAIADLQRHDWGAATGADVGTATKHANAAETAAVEAKVAELSAELTLSRSQLRDAIAGHEADVARLRTLLAKEKSVRLGVEARAAELEAELEATQQKHRESLDALAHVVPREALEHERLRAVRLHHRLHL